MFNNNTWNGLPFSVSLVKRFVSRDWTGSMLSVHSCDRSGWSSASFRSSFMLWALDLISFSVSWLPGLRSMATFWRPMFSHHTLSRICIALSRGTTASDQHIKVKFLEDADQRANNWFQGVALVCATIWELEEDVRLLIFLFQHLDQCCCMPEWGGCLKHWVIDDHGDCAPVEALSNSGGDGTLQVYRGC